MKLAFPSLLYLLDAPSQSFLLASSPGHHQLWGVLNILSSVAFSHPTYVLKGQKWVSPKGNDPFKLQDPLLWEPFTVQKYLGVIQNNLGGKARWQPEKALTCKHPANLPREISEEKDSNP